MASCPGTEPGVVAGLTSPGKIVERNTVGRAMSMTLPVCVVYSAPMVIGLPLYWAIPGDKIG